MIFASTELAARVERAECRMLTDAADAVRREQAGRDALVVPVDYAEGANPLHTPEMPGGQ